LRVVRRMRSHPTADAVYAEVRKEIPGISLGTVYRNLKLLAETGEVTPVAGSGVLIRYDGCTDNHHHFRCDSCGCVLDVDEPVDTGLDRRVAARTGLAIRCHSLVFHGLCEDCQSRERGSTQSTGRERATEGLQKLDGQPGSMRE
jgi:Fur family peroxide stress response transcriptional regulator